MPRELDACAIAERSLIKKYRKTLWNPFIAAVKRLAINARLDLDTAKLLIAEYKKTRTPEHTPGRDK